MVTEKELADLKYGITETRDEDLLHWYNFPDLHDIQTNRVIQAELIRRGLLPDVTR